MNADILSKKFLEHFACAPTHTVHAPGRVNLIGEHTDYNGGFVFPAAINVGTTICASARTDNTIEVLALDFDGQTNVFTLDKIIVDNDAGWANYVRGVVLALQASFPHIGGANLIVTGNVPQGAGLSSSASFEIAILKAFKELYRLELGGVQAALLGQKAENDFVGCACGIMDQLISALGQKDCAMLLDCNDLSYKHTPLPKSCNIMIINSNVKRGLVDSEYNLRRQQCEQAAQILAVKSLREVNLDTLQAHKDSMPAVVFKRARHIVTENTRTLAMFDALQHNNFAAVSRLMAQSHVSMRDDFEITVPAIDTLVALVSAVLTDKGGVRMTGGGFGGCAVALVPDALVEAVKTAVNKDYEKLTGYSADIYLCSAEQGAFA